MATIVEKMNGVIIQSPFFATPANFEFFPIHESIARNPNSSKKNRVALLYGANGSGKSTIAQGIRECTKPIEQRSVNVQFTANGSPLSAAEGSISAFIFDETYIAQNIKVQQQGLGSIVLFGHQVQLEDKIRQTEEKIRATQEDLGNREAAVRKYANPAEMCAPAYWKNRIIKTLQKAGGWAEMAGMRIKRNQIKSRVTDETVKVIGNLSPDKDEANIQSEFNRLMELFESTTTFTNPITPAVNKINVPYDTLSVVQIELAQKPQSKPLSDREQELLDAFGVSVLASAKGYLSVEGQEICSQCLQPISKEHKEITLSVIERILNREIDDFRQRIKSLLIPEIQMEQYDCFAVVDATLLEKIRALVQLANIAIRQHNQLVTQKVDDPFAEIQYDVSIDVGKFILDVNTALAELETKRKDINRVISSRRTTEKRLLDLNDQIAHYIIAEDYEKMQTQEKAEQEEKKQLDNLKTLHADLHKEKVDLDAQRKNIQLAADEINKALSYIFFSDHRLEVSLGSDQLYHLKVNGQPVLPEKLSCGERNALALCYFFADLLKETEAKNMYSREMLLVIDDPISSFDVHNRVGILSFLRFKLEQILFACPTTKVLILTHDISVLFDTEKALEEIAKACSARGKDAEFRAYELKDKTLHLFNINSHNEYTKMMEFVYEYGNNPSPEKDVSIGNVTRRLLEAFSTFSYKEGIEKVSLNSSVLNLISNPQLREYFQYSMYRLVLNTESHSFEAMRGIPEESFYSHLSPDEKQRTAKDIICFMYSVNPLHVTSHLPSAKSTIESWIGHISNQT